MYSKPNYRDKNEIIIPDNYRGNAFTEASPQEIPEHSNNAEENTADKTAVSVPKIEQEAHQTSFLAPFLPPRVSTPHGIFNNIGLEELLIIGVLILLSQGENDDDVLLLLFLLLFYK